MDWIKQLYRDSKGFRVVLHLGYWILAWGFTNFMFGYGNLLNPYSLLYSSIILMVAAGVSYWIIYFLIPHFLVPGKYGLFFGILISTIIVSLDIELLTTIVFVLLYEKFQVLEFFQNTRDIYSLVTGTYFIVLLSVTIKLVEFWYQEQYRKQEAMKQKIETELKLLKSQIHPHFLFNTLNNIYSLALQKSDQAPDAILKLSGLLDYLIYHGQNERVSLSQETALIDNYIELENLRYGDRLELDFQISGDTEHIQVAPLLLLPLVENAFKHGISKTRNKQCLKIKLEITGRNVDFYIENTRPPKDSSENSGRGMGLANLRKRLELLYQGRNSLDIYEDENKFTVHMKLET